MSDEKLVDGFGEVEKDAIGEIMNITMGSAATAVSNLLSAKVWITTPTVTVISAKDLSFPELEPSIMVRIKYVQGVSGQNVLVLKQNDVQLILDQLMGLPLEVTDDFKFDEMNISAVCEVMNQMMGAAATALSEIIDTTVDISTPEAIVEDSQKLISDLYEVSGDENVVSIKFNLTIDGVINSEFISVLTIDLAKEMAEKMMAGYSAATDEAVSASSPAADTPTEPASSGATLSQAEIEALLNGGVTGAASTPQPTPAPTPMQQAASQQTAPQPTAPQQPMQGMPQMQQMPNGMPMQGMYGYDPNMQQYGMYGQMPQGMPQQSMPNQAMPNGMPNMYPQQPYGYPQQPQPQMNIQPVQLQSFASYSNASLNKEQNDNLKLLMGVPLNVSVEIGSTTKKVKEILEFTQGTIIELERQAGAPVDIVVNGNLIAKGDVVVIDDNFAVRITEIIRSKFLDNLGKE